MKTTEEKEIFARLAVKVGAGRAMKLMATYKRDIQREFWQSVRPEFLDDGDPTEYQMGWGNCIDQMDDNAKKLLEDE